MVENFINIPITSLGGAINIDVTQPCTNYRIVPASTPMTLSGNLSFSPTGSVSAGTTVIISNYGSVVKQSFTYSIFGFRLDTTRAYYSFEAKCVYNGSTWEVYFTQNQITESFINASQIIDDTITTNKLQNESVSTFKIEYQAVDSYRLGDDAVIASKVMDGQITTQKLADSAVTTIKIANQAVTGDKIQNETITTEKYQNGSITPQKLSSTAGLLSVATVNISSAQMLAIFNTLIEVVPNPGIGRSVIVIGATATIDYNSTPYATNTQLLLISSGGVEQHFSSSVSFLSANATQNSYLTPVAGTGSNPQIVQNSALYVTAGTGNPTAGDSPVTVTVYYVIQ